MGLGKQKVRQHEMFFTRKELPHSPDHAFYDCLQAILKKNGFDRYV